MEQEPGRRILNTGTTEAQWLEAEGWFKDGLGAMEVARRLDVAFSTVNNRLRRSGIYRRDGAVLNGSGRRASRW